MWFEQFLDLRAAFKDFAWCGMTDAPIGRNPTNCIFYDSRKFNLIASGGYWLSETPHVPGSSSWDSDCIRIANWVRLLDRKQNTEFRVVNTHLDHISQSARENQARLVIEDANGYPSDYPQILVGDLNSDHTNPAIQLIKSAGWHDAIDTTAPEVSNDYTFHGFEGEKHVPFIGRIDWIFLRGAITARSAEIVKDNQDGRFPSDHYFISATLDLSSLSGTAIHN